jgi:magnesium-transporting ATPase (P-type)
MDSGRMLVVAVGMNTQYGILKEAVLLAGEEQPETGLQKKLVRVVKCMMVLLLLVL